MNTPNSEPTEQMLNDAEGQQLVQAIHDRKSASPEAEHEHSWSWWGSDPYLICACGAIQDALNGRIVKEGGE